MHLNVCICTQPDPVHTTTSRPTFLHNPLILSTHSCRLQSKSRAGPCERHHEDLAIRQRWAPPLESEACWLVMIFLMKSGRVITLPPLQRELDRQRPTCISACTSANRTLFGRSGPRGPHTRTVPGKDGPRPHLHRILHASGAPNFNPDPSRIYRAGNLSVVAPR